ncbi:MAG: 23S rRNA (uracil(1939)-C(5))-methyltransferase RlmD [Candidatus Omnitrophica bacterium]|jgi:23S rRNA (uracil-5-)-methyltransferase RumA|nr:23S rRNA (uracil(1939)-C(5))-methyltransferase RlmD [Candidatus Omnitrophota bacterium]MDD5079819.1 23S rRNA (uracil(1939)-C(5))-methyltransferase RlmD [Candidatus Omnitrophota bacterium]
MRDICRHFNSCGGCDSQDQDYEKQLQFKEKYCRNLLACFNPGEIKEIIPSQPIWYFRNKMEFVFSRDSSGAIIGQREKAKFSQIIDLKECRVFIEGLDRIFDACKLWIKDFRVIPYDLRTSSGELRYISLRHSKAYGSIMAVITVALTREDFDKEKNKFFALAERLMSAADVRSVYLCFNKLLSDKALTDELMHLSGDDDIRENINGIDYLIGPKTFFQTNPYCCQKLYAVVRDEVKDAPGTALDIFCGSAGITLQLAGNSSRVIGVDNSAFNIANAEKNLRLNKIDNVEFACLDADTFLAGLKESDYIEDAQVAVIDPPRVGLSKKFKKSLLDIRLKRIIYISCNPMSLREDLKLLCGSYSLERVIPVDMFPHTGHFEVVAGLRLKE